MDLLIPKFGFSTCGLETIHSNLFKVDSQIYPFSLLCHYFSLPLLDHFNQYTNICYYYSSKKKKRSPLTAHLCLYPLCCFSGSCKNISSVFKLVPLLFLPMLITLFPHHFTKTFIQVVIILPKVMFNCLSSYLTFEYHLRWLIILFSKYVLPLPSKWCFFIILMEKHMT